MLPELPLEIRLAARAVARRPWQPIVAATTLAIAIGAVGLTFAGVYGVVGRPLVYRDPARTIVVRDATDLLSANDVDALRRATSVESVAGFRETRPTIRDGDRTRRIPVAEVELPFLAALGVNPSRGRGFVADDYSMATASPVMISHALAERWRVNGALLGSSIFLDGEAHVVVGVMPPGFDFPNGAAAWTPLRRVDARRDDARFEAVARIRSRGSYAQSNAELETMGRRRAANRRSAAQPQPFHVDRLDDVVRASAKPAFWLTVGVVVLVFLLTITTLTNLFVARAIARSRDVAVHTALGSTSAQLFRQQVAESAMVCGVGAIIGGMLIAAGARLLPQVFAGREWMPAELVIDWRVVMAVIGIAVVVATILALATVVRFKEIDVQSVLRSGAVATASRRQRRTQAVLLAVELAMVMFLVMTAGTLAESYRDSERLEWGYDTRHIVFGTVSLAQSRFAAAAERLAVATRVRDALLGARTGGRVTVFAESFPMWNDGGKSTTVEMTGVHGVPMAPHASIDIDTSYFATMGIRLIAGRGITIADVAGAPTVVVIDERIARRNWPNGNAIGQQMRFVEQEPNGPWYTVVGIAEAATEISFIAELVARKRVWPTAVYRSLAQVNPTWPEIGERFAPGFAFAVHVSSDVDAHAATVRRAVTQAAPDQPLEHFGTLQSYFNASGLATRAKATVFAIACGFGVVLCMLGVVGLVADAVVRRTREIGIRVALGASRGSVIGLVVQESVSVGVIGVVVGLALSIAAARVFGHLIFGVGGGVDDPLIVAGGMTAILGLVVLAACAPALRASAVNPAIALRAE